MKTASCLMWLLIGLGSLAAAGDPDLSLAFVAVPRAREPNR
jgi:hypothetical protein